MNKKLKIILKCMIPSPTEVGLLIMLAFAIFLWFLLNVKISKL